MEGLAAGCLSNEQQYFTLVSGIRAPSFICRRHCPNLNLKIAAGLVARRHTWLMDAMTIVGCLMAMVMDWTKRTISLKLSSWSYLTQSIILELSSWSSHPETINLKPSSWNPYLETLISKLLVLKHSAMLTPKHNLPWPLICSDASVQKCYHFRPQMFVFVHQ